VIQDKSSSMRLIRRAVGQAAGALAASRQRAHARIRETCVN